MQLFVGPRLLGRGVLLVSVLLLPAMEAVAQTGPSSLRLLPRTLLDAVTLPIHTLQARSPADNTTVGAGLSAVTLSADRECVFGLLPQLVDGHSPPWLAAGPITR